MPELRIIQGEKICGVDFILEDGTHLHSINAQFGGRYSEYDAYAMGWIYYEPCISEETGELLGFDVTC